MEAAAAAAPVEVSTDPEHDPRRARIGAMRTGRQPQRLVAVVAERPARRQPSKHDGNAKSIDGAACVSPGRSGDADSEVGRPPAQGRSAVDVLAPHRNDLLVIESDERVVDELGRIVAGRGDDVMDGDGLTSYEERAEDSSDQRRLSVARRPRCLAELAISSSAVFISSIVTTRPGATLARRPPTYSLRDRRTPPGECRLWSPGTGTV